MCATAGKGMSEALPVALRDMLIRVTAYRKIKRFAGEQGNTWGGR